MEKDNEQLLKLKEEIEKREEKEKEQKEKLKGLTIEELEAKINYKYNEKGELLDDKGNRVGKLDQETYVLVGMYVMKYIYNLMTKQQNMNTLFVPNSKAQKYEEFLIKDSSQAQCEIFATKDFETNEKCLLLIQGTGAVRPGMWARSVCINDSLKIGSMIPYIQKATQLGYSVVVFNPNQRTDIDQEDKKIDEFRTMESHSLYVYKTFIKDNANIKDIKIVAHSMGGECTMRILIENENDLLSGRIQKIAFTDSVHGLIFNKLSENAKEFARKICRNYVTSDKPAGTFISEGKDSYGGVDRYSSGHEKHEYTSGYAIDEVFKFLTSP